MATPKKRPSMLRGCLAVIAGLLILGWCGSQLNRTRSDADTVALLAPPATAAPTTQAKPTPTDIAVVPTDTPVPIETPSYVAVPPGDPVGTVMARANVRNAPNTNGDNIIGQVDAGETVALTGRLGSSEWYAVRTASGVAGWMSADLVTADPLTVQALQVEVPPVVEVQPTVPAPAASGPAAPSGGDCPASAPIKGNQGDEWIYHVPGGGSYDRTEPEQCFATGADAEAAGYRAARN